MTTSPKDFYQLLGVPEKADRDEIRAAYRRLAKQYHPDANPDDEATAERFKEIGEAYGVLSDETKRKKYDQMRTVGAFNFGGRTRDAGGFGGPTPGGGGFSFEDLGGLGGLSDIFTSIFDRGRRSGGVGPRKGRDVELPVELSFPTAARGGKVPVTVPITEECATCSGSGARPGTGVESCTECAGSGVVSFGQGGFAVNRPCPACMGRGTVPEIPCGSCRGSGTVRQQRKLQVSVPAGTESGSKQRLAGQGERGIAGGEPGDLILIFQVKPHNFFRQEGANICVTVPINVAQAVLGSTLRVKTVDGRHVVLRIPPGTQTGTKFRIRGQGVLRNGKRGDQFVQVTVEVPETISEEGRERMREFAKASELRY